MTTSEDKSETIYVGCECHSPEHIIRVSYWEWQNKEQPEIYFQLQADAHLGFWDRLKMAWKYVFFGENLEWHDVVASYKDMENLNRVLNTYMVDYKEWEKNVD